MEIDWGSILQLLLEVLIKVLLPILLGVAIKAGYNAWDYIKANTDAKKLEFAVGLARQLVQAAQMNGLSGAIKNSGAEKKKYVINLLEVELARKGIKMDLDVLDALVEAQVKEAIKDMEFPAV